MEITVDKHIQKISTQLANLDLPSFIKVHRHEKAMTSEEQAKLIGPIAAGSVLLKNLLLKDKKKNVFLVVIESDRSLDMKMLVKQIPDASSAFRFVADSEVFELLGVDKGAVTPLAVLNDITARVTVVLSKVVLSSTTVLLHPMTNEATAEMATSDFVGFLKAANHVPIIVDFAVQVEDPRKQVPKSEKKKKEVVEKQPQQVSLGMDIPKTPETFGPWYAQLVLRSEMIDYSDVSGCYILRPWSYFIWEQIQTYMDSKIKKMGVKNSYFPLFVSEAALDKEKNHVEGFSAEVAWVTKAGKNTLDHPIAIRPTSETVMYPLMSRWIRSYRDLPLKLNQWSNVVRWEFKHPTPFIRSREFLWQEGHTAHATEEAASLEVIEVLELYSSVYEELLACPIIKGRKTEREKFAGAVYTMTAEAFVPTNGRGVQAATSHALGQNFAKMFKIEFESGSNTDKNFVWQNSWGLTTRSIGVMVMVHSDDKGLVLPPRVAPVQCIVIPIYYANTEENVAMDKAVATCLQALGQVDVRSESDCRTVYTPGWKYNYWELKGVPLRIEIGPRDLKACQVVAVRRDTSLKKVVPIENLSTEIPALLQTMQAEMLNRARAESNGLLKQCTTWGEFIIYLNQGNRVLVPFCESEHCEGIVKERSKAESNPVEEVDLADSDAFVCERLTGSAKSLCIPFEQPMLAPATKCFSCNNTAKSWTLFGRSY